MPMSNLMDDFDTAPSSDEPAQVGLLHGSIHTFVVRSGRLTDGQKKALARYKEQYLIPYSAVPSDLALFFSDIRPIILEIGFGMGEATWQIAQQRPQFNYLGIEVYTPGVAKLIMELEHQHITNVRIIQHDAIEVLKTMINPESLAGIHIFIRIHGLKNGIISDGSYKNLLST